MTEPRPLRRDAALTAVVFLATLVILGGSWSVLRGATTSGDANGRPTERPTDGIAASGGTAGPGAGSPGTGGSGPRGSQLVPSFEPRASGQAPTVIVTGAGDIASCGSDGAVRTAALLAAQQGWFFTAGDNAYDDGSATSYANCFAPTWGRVFDRTILPAPGERDWATKDAAGYRGYFGAQATPNGTTWYSMDLGAWHVVVLDSDCAQVGGCDAGSEQGRWLARDLAASSAHCTLGIWSAPRFSSGEHGDDPDVAPFWQMLQDAHAELIVNGRDRDYERFAPMDAAGVETRPGGLREIVAGTGGAGLGQFQATAANSEFRLAGSYGVLRLTLHPADYDWEFLPVGGAVADAGSGLCR